MERLGFRAADDLYASDPIALREMIRIEYSEKVQVLSIGYGGRKKCRFASVMTDSKNAFGRGGGGAVFGSKNLYAIAVQPEPKLSVHVCHPDTFKLEKKESIAQKIKLKLDMGKFTKKEEFFGILPSLGLIGLLGMIDHFGQLVHNNMRDTTHRIEDINKISGEALRRHEISAGKKDNKIKVKKEGCYHCSILCKRKIQIIDRQGNVVEKGEGPEFESAALLGANLSIYQLEPIIEANVWANIYGLDTITLGSTIAAFFELYDVIKQKNGALTMAEKQFKEDVKSFLEEVGEPCFGNADLLLPMIHLIVKQEGLGKLLAQGSYRFCNHYGHPELSMSVKKLELSAYDPRGSFSQALCYEMSNRGGCHLHGGYTALWSCCAGYGEWPSDRIEGTPIISRNATLKNTSLDIMGFCLYGSLSLGLDDYAALISSITGKGCNAGILTTIAERTVTLEREFNIRCGLTKEDDILPQRFYQEAITVGGKERILDREDFRSMRAEYYRSFGWDQDGVPTDETLKKLSIFNIVHP
jgi:aldehyde:ferredoxin oxidoreductase